MPMNSGGRPDDVWRLSAQSQIVIDRSSNVVLNNNITLQTLSGTPKNIILKTVDTTVNFSTLYGADNQDAYDFLSGPSGLLADVTIFPPPVDIFHNLSGGNNDGAYEVDIGPSGILFGTFINPTPPPGTVVHSLPFLTTLGQLRSM